MMYKCFMPEDWKSWIDTNLTANCPKSGMFHILMNHGFDFDLVRDILSYEPMEPLLIERKQRQTMMLAKEDNPVIVHPNKRLADMPDAVRLDTCLADIYYIDNFLGSLDCSNVIAQMEKNLAASTVTDPYADKSVRTSSTSHLDCREPDIDRLERKIHGFMDIGLEYGEELQGQRYLVGQEFKSHTDYFDANVSYNQTYLDRGQRTWTLMIYLDDCEDGGETKFTKLNVSYKPKTGAALLWNNQRPDGSGNPYTEHWGMPVKAGQKNVVTKWFREKPTIRQIR